MNKISDEQLQRLNESASILGDEIEDWLHNDDDGVEYGVHYIDGFMNLYLGFVVEEEVLIVDLDIVSDAGDRVEVAENRWEWQYDGEFDEDFFVAGILSRWQEEISEFIMESVENIEMNNPLKIRVGMTGFH